MKTRRCYIIGAAVALYLMSTVTLCANETVVLTDMAGRRVAVPQPVQRIVTTFKPASLCLLSLKLQESWAGLDTPSALDPLQQAIFPGVAKLPGVGSKSMGINMETLAGLAPHLVVLYSQKDGLALAGRLDALGIPSIIIVPETFDTIKASLRVMARAAGVPERAAIPVREMDAVLDLLASRLDGLPVAGFKKGYFSSPLSVFATVTSGMIQHQVMAAAGVKNVAGALSGYFRDVSAEQLIQWQPQVIVLSQRISSRAAQALARPYFQAVPAVRSGRVYRCPSQLAPWDFPSPLSVLASLWLGQKVFPERFNGVDLQDRADRFHKVVFGKTLTGMGGHLNDGADLAP